MNFNQCITFAITQPMQDLSDFVFVNMAKMNLARHDSYLDHRKSGIKHDTPAVLKTAPIHLSICPDSVIQKTEEEIFQYDDQHYSVSSHKKTGQYHPYAQSSIFTSDTGRKSGPTAWKLMVTRSQNGGCVWQGLQLLTTT